MHCWTTLLLPLLLLAGTEVRGDMDASASELTEADLLGPMLQMLTGSSSSHRHLSLCDLAVSLLQAVEATKAERLQEARRRQQRGRERSRRAHHHDDDDDSANPVLVSIVKAYLRALREDERARRRRSQLESQLTRVRQDLEEQLRRQPEEADILLWLPLPLPAEEDEAEVPVQASASVIQRIL